MRAERDHDAPPRDEGGFVVIEVVIATIVLLMSVIAVAAQLGTQFLSISTSATQQVAAGLLNQAMEQVRALPYTFVAEGLSPTDSTVTSDSNIVVNGSTCKTNNTAIWNPAEVVPCAAPSGDNQVPFVPHISTTSVNGTPFTVAAYPSIDAADTGSGADVYRVTIVVSWPSNQVGPKQLVAQTLVYSAATGCITSTNHPFAAPCQPFLYSGAQAGGGVITIIPDSAANNPIISGLSLTSVELLLDSVTSDAEIEQVSRVLGSVSTSGGDYIDTTTQSSGAVSGSVSADNDPGTSTSSATPASVAQSGTGTIEDIATGSDANWLSLTPASGDSGTTMATADATSSPACDDLSLVQQFTSLPCGASSSTQSGSAASLLMGLFAGSSSLGSTTLASVAGQPTGTPNETFVGRYTSSGGTWCTTTTGDGCVHAGAQMSLGTVEIGGLPSAFVSDNAVPASWGAGATDCPAGNYFVAVTNYSARASSESGVLAGLPAASVPFSGGATPYLCYWSGAGYTAVPITWGSSAPSVTFPTVTATDSSVATGAVTVTMTPSLVVEGLTTATSLPSGCSSVCTASASVPSPIEGDIVYKVTQGTTVLADLDIHVNLGSLLASTSYQAAP